MKKYKVVVNLMPQTLKGWRREYLEGQIAKLIGFPLFQTMTYSIDDAITLWKSGNSASYVIVNAPYYFSLIDLERLKTSGVVIKFRNFGEQLDPNIKYIADKIPVHNEHKYLTRELTDINIATIHHTAVSYEGVDNLTIAKRVASYHVNHHGWPGAGYTYLVCNDGEILQLNNINTISYHAGSYSAPGDENKSAVGIALTGDFTVSKPTKWQIYSAKALVNYLRMIIRNQIVAIPHKRMPGAATSCPGDNIEHWMRMIDGTDEIPIGTL